MIRMNQFIGTAEAARTLRKSRATISRMVDSGELPTAGTVGPKHIRVFDRAEIERLAAEGARDE